MMRICLFGDFDPAYSRNRVLKKGLQEAGAEIVLCVTKEKGIRRFSDLLHLYRALPSHDLVIVAYSDSRLVVPFVRLISRAPVVWDAFYSLYDAFVSDRALISRANPKAWGYWLADFVSAHLARQILLDTDTHITYFARAFLVPRTRFVKVLVGTDDALFIPVSATQAHSPLVVGFYGKYIPLQGAEVIVRAAHLLAARADIRFLMIGSGQTYAKVRDLATELKADNIEFRSRIPYEEFPALIASFDIALGIFGTTGKAARVIPNKVYDAMAMGKPIVTGDTPGIRELLQHNHNAYLIPRGDPQALAAAIEALAADESLRVSLGTHALLTYRSHATPQVIGEGLLTALSEVLQPGIHSPRLRIDFWLPHLKVAGGTKVTLTYASLLAKRGHRVRVFVLHTGWRERLFGAVTWKREFNIPVSYVRNWEEACRHRSDVVVADSWQVAAALLSCNPPKRLFEFVQHDERLYHGEPQAVEAVYRSPKLRKIVVSTWLKEIFQKEFSIDPILVANTIDREAFSPMMETRSDSAFRVLLLVHTLPWKGTQEGIAIVTALKKEYPHIKLIGFGVRTKECPAGLDEYHYNPSQSKLRELYASSDVLLCPSWYEGFGLPSLEAMACGAALVTYDNGGSRDYAIDGETALVASNQNRKVLTEKLRLLIADDRLRKHIAVGGRKFIEHLPTLWEQSVLLERFLMENGVETRS